MLSEMLMTRIPGLKMLQINTDGLTVVIDNKYKRLYWDICKEWETMTQLGLEYVAYSKMVIRDVNNYIAVAQKTGKVKYKGTFKDNYEMRKDEEYHKAFNQGIVSTAVNKYFLENIPVEKTINECQDIYEFCKTGNTTGQWWAETFDLNENNEEVNIEKQQKTNRYYVSLNGKRFRKCTYKPDKKTGEDKLTSTEYEAGRTVTIFNRYYEDDIKNRNLDYQYYIDECYKIIHVIDGTLEKQQEEQKAKKLQEKLEKEESDYIKFCVEKIPTELQYEKYKRDWLIEKHGIPSEIKPSKRKS